VVYIPLTPSLDSQEQAYLSEFEADPSYMWDPAKKKKIKIIRRNPEMAQWLRTLAALPEVQNSNPSNHMVAHNHL
jgi:hypothetical protein